MLLWVSRNKGVYLGSGRHLWHSLWLLEHVSTWFLKDLLNIKARWLPARLKMTRIYSKEGVCTLIFNRTLFLPTEQPNM